MSQAKLLLLFIAEKSKLTGLYSEELKFEAMKYSPGMIFFVLTLTFYNCVVPKGFLPWEIWVASPWKAYSSKPLFPTYGACWVF